MEGWTTDRLAWWGEGRGCRERKLASYDVTRVPQPGSSRVNLVLCGNVCTRKRVASSERQWWCYGCQSSRRCRGDDVSSGGDDVRVREVSDILYTFPPKDLSLNYVIQSL